MSEVKAFTNEEITNISTAKERLQKMAQHTGIYCFSSYNFATDKYSSDPLMTPEENTKLVVTGGVIASLLLDENVNDIDVFILKKDLSLFNRLINMKPGNWSVRYFFDLDNDDREEEYHNPHVFAIATEIGARKVQYILTDFNDRKSLLHDFDFLHCTASYHEGMLYINRETYDAIINKKLVPQDKNKAIKRNREQKFIDRGWSTPIDDLIKAPSKTLKEILENNLMKSDNWYRAAKSTRWYDQNIPVNSVKDKHLEAMQKALVKNEPTYSVHGDDITLDDIYQDLLDTSNPNFWNNVSPIK